MRRSGALCKSKLASPNFMPHFVQKWDRRKFKLSAGALTALSGAALWATEFSTGSVLLSGASALFGYLGYQDMNSQHHAIRANFPVLGRLRYLAESVRPEIQQYFIESNEDGRPFSRKQREMVYVRSKGAAAKLPFGTALDVNAEGHEWITHSMSPKVVPEADCRVTIGNLPN
jgi:hypothetical protein